jgi:hypothetical protein
VFNLVPVAQHVRSVLPAPLDQVTHCFSLGEETVLAWSRGGLGEAEERALRGLMSAASRTGVPWATVYDPSAGPVVVAHAEGGHVFEQLAEVLEAHPPAGMTILLANMTGVSEPKQV